MYGWYYKITFSEHIIQYTITEGEMYYKYGSAKKVVFTN